MKPFCYALAMTTALQLLVAPAFAQDATLPSSDAYHQGVAPTTSGKDAASVPGDSASTPVTPYSGETHQGVSPTSGKDTSTSPVPSDYNTNAPTSNVDQDHQGVPPTSTGKDAGSTPVTP
jgi:hypothetical protein